MNLPSRCEVSLNTVALFDLGLVSSSTFRSRMPTPASPCPTSPPLPEHQQIALFLWGRIMLSRLLSATRPAWSSHKSKGTHLAGRTGSFSLRPDLFIPTFVIQYVLHARLPLFVFNRQGNQHIFVLLFFLGTTKSLHGSSLLHV